ncbi:AP-1-like transcription factor napA [Colletotrichum sp. SAR11_239]|nr:AP-1-like transcription factor napA [Colletotrichum sp. SAR11_239]
MLDDIDAFLEMEAPYGYEEVEQYLDTASSSESTSPIISNPASDPKAAATTAKPPAKRKRENRYKNAPPSVLSNRASQRAYRERKDQRIKDLEVMLSEQKQKNDSLSQAYSALHAEYLKLRGVQARAHQMPRHHPTTAAPPPMMFDPSAHMGMPTAHPGAMDYADNMYMFQDMQTYTL